MRAEFGGHFLFGSASAAYQIEGAYQADGKGLSVWDLWANKQGKTFEGTNGNVSCDHYHRYLEDVALMKEMGLKAYRFSIAWSRIIPHANREVNELGLKFYNDLINELVANGIEPIVTLYHWDLPWYLQEEYGGFESRKIIDDFLHYAKICFEAFHDRVKYWIVLNEPNIFTRFGYQMALHPPGKKDDTAYINTYHITALVHAQTVLMFKDKKYNGWIGSSIAFTPAYAASSDLKDLEALENFYSTETWWFMDIYYKGTYPNKGFKYYKNRKNLTIDNDEDYEVMRKAASVVDFIGINYYQTATVAYNPLDGVGFQSINTSGKKGTQKENGVPGLYKLVKNENLRYTDWDWAIDPDGLRFGLMQLKDRYNLPILISENGLGAYDQLNEDLSIHDSYRINYLEEHLLAAKKAIDHGVELFGYCTWSFTDLLSWLNGFQKRYGFVYIDFENDLQRRKKDSFYWYKEVIQNNGIK